MVVNRIPPASGAGWASREHRRRAFRSFGCGMADDQNISETQHCGPAPSPPPAARRSGVRSGWPGRAASASHGRTAAFTSLRSADVGTRHRYTRHTHRHSSQSARRGRPPRSAVPGPGAAVVRTHLRRTSLTLRHTHPHTHPMPSAATWPEAGVRLGRGFGLTDPGAHRHLCRIRARSCGRWGGPARAARTIAATTSPPAQSPPCARRRPARPAKRD